MTKIIAFSGKKTSGKNTSANFMYSLFLLHSGLFKAVDIADNGFIRVLKQNDQEVIFDPQQYYLGIGEIDLEIAETIFKLTPTLTIYSLADALKNDVCMNILGLTYEQCYDEQGKNQETHLKWSDMPGIVKSKRGHMTGREVMEYMGTDVFRGIRNNVWSDCTIRRIERESPQFAIITDVRFPDEVESIFKHNETNEVIRLTRNPVDSKSKPECALDKDNFDWSNFSHIVDNENMTIQEQTDALHPIIMNFIGATNEPS